MSDSTQAPPPKNRTKRPAWLVKARSRAWAKRTIALSSIPLAPLLIGTVGGAGLSPIASGTVGSMVAVFLYLFIPVLQIPIVLVLASLIALFAGIYASNIIEDKLQERDPGIIVIDEVFGQWIALISLWHAHHWLYILLAFLYFRLFDIIKLYPASIFERRPGGAGVMLDDGVAGIYANLAAHGTFYLLASIFSIA